MAEGELQSGEPSGRADGKRHPLSRREAGRIKRPPAEGRPRRGVLAGWSPSGGCRFMVPPTLHLAPDRRYDGKTSENLTGKKGALKSQIWDLRATRF